LDLVLARALIGDWSTSAIAAIRKMLDLLKLNDLVHPATHERARGIQMLAGIFD